AGARAQIRYRGITTLAASSSAADASARLDPHGVQFLPFAALDGNPHTAWLSAGERSPVGQWLALRLATPLSPDHLDATFTAPPLSPAPPAGPSPAARRRAVRVTGVRGDPDAGRLDQPVTGTGPHRLAVPPGPTSALRLVITGVAGTAGSDLTGRRVGIATLT